jgi:uncharacterized phage protein (TIGR01671 family)
MREILFRGQRVDTGEWVCGNLITHITFYYPHIAGMVEYLGDGRFEAPSEHWEELDVIPETIGQFTGITDKNNKKIFEGDIVYCNMSYGGGFLPHAGEIVYTTFGAFATKNEAGETLLHNHDLHSFEIKGNIHDNPELLK